MGYYYLTVQDSVKNFVAGKPCRCRDRVIKKTAEGMVYEWRGCKIAKLKDGRLKLFLPSANALTQGTRSAKYFKRVIDAIFQALSFPYEARYIRNREGFPDFYICDDKTMLALDYTPVLTGRPLRQELGHEDNV